MSSGTFVCAAGFIVPDTGPCPECGALQDMLCLRMGERIAFMDDGTSNRMTKVAKRARRLAAARLKQAATP
jgi:hypothetical protein